MILATNNNNKIREIKQILADQEILSLSEAGIIIDIKEDQETFFGNASKKAKEIYEIIKQPVIADDSGLCIEAFEGWPGVLTHRFLGKNAKDKDRNLAILEKMNNLGAEKRNAKVVCSLVYFDGENLIEGIGNLEGSIPEKPRGEYGFGFDEIFQIENGKTLAELRSEEKNQTSARFLATLDLKRKLKEANLI